MRSKLHACLVVGWTLARAGAAYAMCPAAGDTLAFATTVQPQKKWPCADDKLALALLDSLQVKRIDLEIAADPELVRRQLQDLLDGSSISRRIARLRVPAGTSVWPVFRSRLLSMAETGGFPTESLEKVLDSIEQREPYLTTKGQLIPYAALLAHRAGERVWVIPCRWESGYSSPRDGVTIFMTAGHVRAWAFLARSGRQVGYTTCK